MRFSLHAAATMILLSLAPLPGGLLAGNGGGSEPDPPADEEEWDETVAVTAEIEGAATDPLGTTSTLLDPRRGAGTPSTATDLVVAVPGVSQNGQGGLFQVFSIRGVSRNRVLNLVSGMRLFSDRRAGASVSFLDPHLIGSIDVLRGAATTFHGSGALGGVVRVEPQRFDGATVLAGYDSRGDENYEVVGFGDGKWSGGLARRDAGNARAPDGTELDTHFTQYSGVLRYEHAGDSRDWELLYVPSAADDTGKSNTDFPERTTSYPRERHQLLELAMRARSGWSAQAWIHSQELETTVTEADTLSEIENSSLDWGARWQRDSAVSTSTELVFGLDAAGRTGVDATETERDNDPSTGDPPVTNRSLEDASQLELGAFATAARNWSRTRLQAGARASWQGQDNAGASPIDDSALNGFVGLSRQLAQRLELRANVSSGLRFPSLAELYFTGTTGRGEVLGNPDLAPARALGAEVALRWVGKSVLLHAGLFRTAIDDYVERLETAPDVFLWTNLLSGTIEGVEFQAMLLPSPRWILTAGGHAMEGRDDDDAPLADIAPDEIWFGATHHIGPWRLDARWAHRYAKNDSGSGEKPIPAADLVDLRLERAVGDGFTVALVGSNVLDDEYFPSADSKTALAPERSVGLHLGWRRP